MDIWKAPTARTDRIDTAWGILKQQLARRFKPVGDPRTRATQTWIRNQAPMRWFFARQPMMSRGRFVPRLSAVIDSHGTSLRGHVNGGGGVSID